jgi:hypothetical protein
MYTSNFYKKLGTPPPLTSTHFFCFWCDLLGFGEIFYQNNWKLSMEQKKFIYNRLQRAHSIFLENTLALEDVSLILNDGLVKLHEYNGDNDSFHPGFFLRGCVYTHMGIKIDEQKNGLPGPRSILAFGESIKYLNENFTVDDYVFTHTKPKGQELSNLALQTGNPIVVYNPSPFQMNAAFSKSYILDSLGSKYGITGSNIFIDESVIEFSRWFASETGRNVIFEEKNDLIRLIVENPKSFPAWGFKMSKPMEIDYKGWKTKAYKLISFYPPDEKHTDFEIEIE